MFKQIAIVEWEDAVMRDMEADDKPRTAIQTTIGFLLDENNDHVSLVNEYNEKDGSMRGVTTVPFGMIRTIKKISIRKKREKSDSKAQ